MWRFEATSRKATPKGQPSSLAQHRLLEASLPAHQDLHSSFTAHAPAKSRFVWFVPAPRRPGVSWQAARRVASRERAGDQLGHFGAVPGPGPWRRSVVACRLDSSQPWDVFGAYRPSEPSDWLGASHPSNCRGIAPPDGGLLPLSRRSAGIGAWPSPREEPPCLPACPRSSTSLLSSASLGARSRDWAAPRSRAGSI